MGFDIIGAVKSKLYRYTIYTGKTPPVLQIRHCWHMPANLDITKMAGAAKMLVGTMDFKSFATADDKRENKVRTIFRCDVTTKDDWIYIDVQGDSFLYNMVRNIVGTLIEIGIGRWKPEKMNEILQAKDRQGAGAVGPAAGLLLLRGEILLWN